MKSLWVLRAFTAFCFLILLFSPIQSSAQVGPFGQSNMCKARILLKSLPIQKIPQSKQPWRWAATAQIVMDYHGVNREQCELLDAVKAGSNLNLYLWLAFGSPEATARNGGTPIEDICPLYPASECANCCNDSCELASGEMKICSLCGGGGWGEWIFEEFNFTFYPPFDMPLPTLTWLGVTDEICRGRPFISTVSYEVDDLHSVVVHGFSSLFILPPPSRTIILKPVLFKQVQIYDPQEDLSEWVPEYEFRGPDFGHGVTDYVGDTYKIEPYFVWPPYLKQPFFYQAGSGS